MLNIFKAYDVRGIYPNEINEEVAFKLAKACTKHFNAKNCLVAGDVRLSTESLKNSFINSLLDSGLEVYDAKIISTSTFNYLISQEKFDFGVMITASHNPPQYNGFKIYDSEANAIGLGLGLEKIAEIYEKIEMKKENKNGKLINAENLKEKHLNFLLNEMKKFKIKKFKIAIDFGNGCAAILFPEILKILNTEIILLNAEIDGSFKNRLPEPSKENLSELIELIKKEKFDFGVAFDGDADRIVFLDSNGNLLRGDQVAYLFVKFFKPKKIVFDFYFPPYFKKILEKLKIQYKESKVGRAYIANTCKEINADLAFEYSMHVYFKELKHNEDTFLTFIKFLQAVSKISLKKILEEYKILPSISYKISASDEKKFLAIEKFYENVKNEIKVETLDGVKGFFDEKNWFLIRASNTEPIIRVFIEGENENKINEMKEYIDKKINEILSKI